MPTFEIDPADKDRAMRLVEFVRKEFLTFRTEAKFVFAIEMSRLLQPEVTELRRRAAAEPNPGDPA